MKNKLNRDWIQLLDPNKIQIYPIQFANCDRLQTNRAVYIFDEVGSGKTISSGLMALDYLYNNPNKNVLIITENALVKKNDNIPNDEGQFLNDWFNKLPLKYFSKRIKIINNYCSNIKKATHENYGLVIIDEAHKFLNKEIDRTKYLKNIKADKVVFLTATPIKTNLDDLKKYIDIAKKILDDDNLTDFWINQYMDNCEKEKEEVICSLFDPKIPVTRYFKDTIMSLKFDEYKTTVKRLIPMVWEASGNPIDTMINNINDILEKSPNSKFIIFTRYIDREAKKIEENLENNYNFFRYNYNENDNTKSFYLVTGQNSNQLSNFSGNNNLPTILILTYQIAEQGVNLPGYDYVINYHIPSSPSALEQRFGRIDRMNNLNEEINMCFLITKSLDDRRTLNFYTAIDIYLYNFIPHLVSKNTILTKDILEKYKLISKAYFEKLKYLINSKENNFFENLINELKKIDSGECDDNNEYDDCDLEWFINFYKNYSINVNSKNSDNTPINIDNIKDKFLKKIEKIEEKNNNTLRESEFFKKIKNSKYDLGNKIFYFKDENFKEMHTLDAVADCAKIINNSDCYTDYKKTFQDNYSSNLIEEFSKDTYKEIKYIANDFFEKQFNDNNFDNIFTKEEASEKQFYIDIYINKIFKNSNIEIPNFLLKNIIFFNKSLPFFKLCKQFFINLEDSITTKKGKLYVNFPDPWHREGWNTVFIRAFKGLTPYKYKLSQEFLNKYFGQNKEAFNKNIENFGYDYIKKQFRLIVYDKNDKEALISDKKLEPPYIVEASNWYKLTYFYLNYRSLLKPDNKSKSLFEYILTEDESNKFRTYVKRNKEMVSLKLSLDYVYYIEPIINDIYYKENDDYTEEIIKILEKYILR